MPKGKRKLAEGKSKIALTKIKRLKGKQSRTLKEVLPLPWGVESHEKTTVRRERDDKIKLEEKRVGWKSKALGSKKGKKWDR